MKTHLLCLSALSLALAGCASAPTPDTAALGALPVVEYGQPVPADGDFILHFPVGAPVDTPVTFKGDLIERPVSETMSVKLVKDIYMHKQWLSYDRQHWVDARKAIDLKVQVVLPGYNHPEPGFLTLELNSVQ